MNRLASLIALHETFFAELAQANPRNHVLREFLRVGWDPFIAAWYNPALTKDAGAYESRLMTLRANAQALEVPVPDLASPATVSGDPTADAINRETDDRFRAATGVTHRLNRNNAADRALINQWLSLRYEVANEYATRAAEGSSDVAVGRGGGGHGGGGHGHGGWGHGGRRNWGGYGYGGGWGGPYYGPEVVEILPPAPPDDYTYSEDPMQSPDPWAAMQSAPPAIQQYTPPVVSGQRGVYRHRAGLVATLAPVLAPGTAHMDTTLTLDAGNVLHAKICVDGKCYETSLDLSQAIGSLVAQLTGQLEGAHEQWHRQTRALMGAEVAAHPHHKHHHKHHHHHPVVVEAVRSSGEAMIGALLEQHVGVACCGWFDSITNAVSSAAHSVEGAVKSTLKTLGPVIGPAAAMAATAVGGPAAGALASTLVSAAAGNGSAKQVVAAAEQAAATNPQAAQVLATAKSVVAKTTAAYHVAATVQKAAKGNKQAIRQIQDTAASAAQGDPAAQQIVLLLNQVTDAATANDQTDGGQMADAVNGWYTIVGAALNELRDQAIAAAKKSRHGVTGYVLDANGWNVLPFGSADEADDWYGKLDPRAIVYAAYFDRGDPTFPAPLNDKLGQVASTAPVAVPIPRGVATVSGTALVGNMAVTEATIERQKQAALDAYYAAHGAPPDTFEQLVEFVQNYARTHVGAFHTVPWLWPFLTGAFGGVIAERKFGGAIY